MGTSKVLMALTGCLLISGAVADDATVVIEDNAQITFISQARIGDTRLLAWRSDGSGDSIRLMAAFVDANTHQLLDGPFELGAANETFDCPDGANPHGRVTCELTSLLGSYPTVHGSEDSGQFLVTWTSKIRPDIDSSKPQAYDVLGRIIRIDDDGRPDMQLLLRISTVDNDLNSTLQASVGSPVSGIAFNPDTGEYLVTWLGSHLVDENDQPYVQRLNLQGELIGTPVRIYAGIRSDFPTVPTIIYSNDTAEYLVVLPSSQSTAGGQTLLGTSLMPNGQVSTFMRDVMPPGGIGGSPGNAALLPVSPQRTLVFFPDGEKRAANAFWLDMTASLAPSVRTDITGYGAIYSIDNAQIARLPGTDAAVLLYTDNANDGDDNRSTGELRYRTIDLNAPADQPASLGATRTAVRLSGKAVDEDGANRFNLTASDALDEARFVTFFVDASRPNAIQTMEHDLRRNELAISGGEDVTVVAGENVSVSFTFVNLGNADEVVPLRTLPEPHAVLEISLPEGLEITASEGCTLDQAQPSRCAITGPIPANAGHALTFTVSTEGKTSLEQEELLTVGVSLLSELDGMDPSNNSAGVSVRVKPAAQPGTPGDSNDPEDPQQPEDPKQPEQPPKKKGGGGSLLWMLPLLAPLSLRRRLH